jgi:hypothetical protein
LRARVLFLPVAAAIVGDEAGAHDAVQDGIALALKQHCSFRGEGPQRSAEPDAVPD